MARKKISQNEEASNDSAVKLIGEHDRELHLARIEEWKILTAKDKAIRLRRAELRMFFAHSLGNASSLIVDKWEIAYREYSYKPQPAHIRRFLVITDRTTTKNTKLNRNETILGIEAWLREQDGHFSTKAIHDKFPQASYSLLFSLADNELRYRIARSEPEPKTKGDGMMRRIVWYGGPCGQSGEANHSALAAAEGARCE